MADETRKLLKVFGVAVTDFEAEAARLAEQAARLDGASAEEARALLRSVAEALAEVQARWLEVTTHLVALQQRLFDRLAGAKPDSETTGIGAGPRGRQ